MSSPVTRKSGTRSKPHVFNLGSVAETRLAALTSSGLASRSTSSFHTALEQLRVATSSLNCLDLRTAVTSLVTAAQSDEIASDDVADAISAQTTALCRALAKGQHATPEFDLLLIRIIAAGGLAMYRAEDPRDERVLHAENLICALTIQINNQRLAQSGNHLIGAIDKFVAFAEAPTHPTIN